MSLNSRTIKDFSVEEAEIYEGWRTAVIFLIHTPGHKSREKGDLKDHWKSSTLAPCCVRSREIGVGPKDASGEWPVMSGQGKTAANEPLFP